MSRLPVAFGEDVEDLAGAGGGDVAVVLAAAGVGGVDVGEGV